jgi:hypothetical protein
LVMRAMPAVTWTIAAVMSWRVRAHALRTTAGYVGSRADFAVMIGYIGPS